MRLQRERIGGGAALIAAAVVLVSCGGEVVPTERTTAGGAVVRSSVSVAGSTAPANPTTHAAAPQFDRALAQVYQGDGMADAQVTKVLVLMPGFLGGAGNFDYLARRIVERSGGMTAVWAVDRRSNALEDQTGLDAAEAAQDADVAKRYYFHGAAIGGKTFAGFVAGKNVTFQSEWGIKVHVEDLDALITAAIARYPHAAIFLGGHSLGGSIVPIYAAWDFGAYAGFERLSGLVLLEGTAAPKGPTDIPRQSSYETTGLNAGGGVSSLKSVRANPIVSLPFIGPDLFVTSEILAMRVAFGRPQALNPDGDLVANFLSVLFGLTTVPPTTNAAAFGLGFDNDFEPLAFARVSIGTAAGGPIGPNPNAALFGGFVGPNDTLLAPTDSTATYTWIPRSQQTPPDPTDIATFAHVMFAGPSNFIEWYFPARLTLDVGVTAGLNVQPSGDWRKDVYGLAVTENARVDLPVFAVGGGHGLVPDVTKFYPYRDSIAPTLRNGAPRNGVGAGFQTRLQDGYVHLDVLTAYDEAAGNGEFQALVDWMDEAVQLAPPPAR